MKKALLIFFLFLSCFLSACKSSSETEQIKTEKEQIKNPYYLLGVYNIPYHGDREKDHKIKQDKKYLQEIIERAKEYEIKLTLMFPPQWLKHLSEQNIVNWQEAGHELGIVHFGVLHKNWDGYSDVSIKQVQNKREEQGLENREYKGNINDLFLQYKDWKENFKTICFLDDLQVKNIPEYVEYSLCSDFVNFGEVGQKSKSFAFPTRGINEFVNYQKKENKAKYQLSTYHIGNLKQKQRAQDVFYKMRKGVFVSAGYSLYSSKNSFLKWLDFLYQRDRETEKNITAPQIIHKEILPTKEIF